MNMAKLMRFNCRCRSWEVPGILARGAKDMTIERAQFNSMICGPNVYAEAFWKNDRVLPVSGFESGSLLDGRA